MINPHPLRTSPRHYRRAAPTRGLFRAGLVVMALAGILTALLGPAAHADPGPGASGRVATTSSAGCTGGAIDYFELTGIIDQVSARSLIQEIGVAEKTCSRALVVRLDTPGGLRVSVTSIVDHIQSATVPIIVWIAPQGAVAAGAGVFVAAAAPIIVMAPGTTLGPVLPVNLDSAPGSGTAALATLRSLAAGHGRTLALTSGSATLSDSQAAQGGVSAFGAGELGTLLQNLENRSVTVQGAPVTLTMTGAPLRFHKMSVWARLVHSADRPAVAYMLVLLGLFGLVFELYFPGIGAAGLMGGAALALGLFGFAVLPTSWAALTLVIISVCLFVPDLHVGGLGVPTAAGTVGLLVGSVLLFPHAQPALALPWWAIAAGVIGTLVFFISIMTAALRARFSRPPAGAEGLIGSIGVARTDLAPDGEVSAAGAVWRARTLGAAIAEGSRVRVRSASGLLLLVDPVELEAGLEVTPGPGDSGESLETP